MTSPILPMRALTIAFLSFAFATLSAAPASNASLPLALNSEIEEITTPAAAGAMGSDLTTSSDGSVYLSWVEPASEGRQALRVAAFDREQRRWSQAHTVAEGRDWLVNHANFPAVVAQSNGRLTAVWLETDPAPAKPAHSHGHSHHSEKARARFSRSADGGATWSPPQLLTTESDAIEFPALQPLADGRVLAAWLDGRAKQSGKKAQRLYARILGSTTESAPDTLLDDSVCDCCQLGFTAFPDGSALLAYRGRTSDEIRDIMTTRFVDEKWEAPRSVSRDGWKIAGCPVNGPQLAAEGPRVATAWFTAADREPRVLVATSPDAGGTFTIALRADLGKPLGRVDTVMLRDGSQLVTWLEGQGEDASQPPGIYLRRYASFGATLPPVRLAPAVEGRGTGFPRLALVKEDDAREPAELLVTFTRAEEPSRLATLLVTLPDAATLATIDSACDCSANAVQATGYPFRGQIVGVSTETNTLRVRHGPLPGLLRAGETEFKVAANVAAAVTADRHTLARIEQRNGEWWIFDVRLLVPPKR